MDVWSHKDVGEDIEDPERIKSASGALQVMDKVIRFLIKFDNEELRESILIVIETPNFKKTPDKNNNILSKKN